MKALMQLLGRGPKHNLMQGRTQVLEIRQRSSTLVEPADPLFTTTKEQDPSPILGRRWKALPSHPADVVSYTRAVLHSVSFCPTHLDLANSPVSSITVTKCRLTLAFSQVTRLHVVPVKLPQPYHGSDRDGVLFVVCLSCCSRGCICQPHTVWQSGREQETLTALPLQMLRQHIIVQCKTMTPGKYFYSHTSSIFPSRSSNRVPGSRTFDPCMQRRACCSFSLLIAHPLPVNTVERGDTCDLLTASVCSVTEDAEFALEPPTSLSCRSHHRCHLDSLPRRHYSPSRPPLQPRLAY